MISLPGSPFGIAWFILYGHQGVPAIRFMPRIRELNGGFTKIYLYWQQAEPEKGRFDWSAVDAFVDQLQSADEGLISLFSSSMWAVERPSAMLPPSPAKNLEDYYDFVFELVKRYRGRVRYWQNDAEPNNPVFWSGSADEFVKQLKVFYRAVKDADDAAVVIAGGYDGLFVPPSLSHERPPFPQQERGLAFFDTVFREAGEAFDLFDLRLYGDPYSITARVDYMRERMTAFGLSKPIVCTEYGGPNLFEFAENRKYVSLVAAWSQAMTATDPEGNPAEDLSGASQIAKLYEEMETLPPQTQMFMQGCSPELEGRYQRIQSRSVVMRNLLALSAGVQKTLYWDLPVAPGKRDDLMTLMYGKIGLAGHRDGVLTEFNETARTFARMAETLRGVRDVKRLESAGRPSIFVFEVDCGERGPVHVIWERRDLFAGEDAPAVPFSLPWALKTASAVDCFGTEVPVELSDGVLHLSVSANPVYIAGGDIP